MTTSVYTDKQILSELKRVYAKLDRPFTRREYDAHAEVSKSTVERRFGSWRMALSAAKLLSKFEQFERKQKQATKSVTKKVAKKVTKKVAVKKVAKKVATKR